MKKDIEKLNKTAEKTQTKVNGYRKKFDEI